MLKKILIVLSLLIVNSYGGEATLEKAQHRLPPVIYSLDIPKVVKPNQTYDFKWTVMGYHDEYDIIINIYDKNNKKIASKQVSSYNETQGAYSWDTIRSTKFFYETQINLNFSGSQELTVRFFASPPNDYINTTFLSCLVPGGLGYKAGDTTGRKILIDGGEGSKLGQLPISSIDTLEANKEKIINFELKSPQKVFLKTRTNKGKYITSRLYNSDNQKITLVKNYYEAYTSDNQKNGDSITSTAVELETGIYKLSLSSSNSISYNLWMTTIDDEHTIQNVPFQTQRVDNECGSSNYLCGYVASTMLLANKYHISPSIKIANTLRKDSNVSCGELSSIDDNLNGLKAYKVNMNAYFEAMTYDEIKATISNDIPIQVSIKYSDFGDYKLISSWNGGHSVVIVGYSGSKSVWYIHDPLGPNSSLGAYREIPSYVFRKALKFGSIIYDDMVAPVVLIVK